MQPLPWPVGGDMASQNPMVLVAFDAFLAVKKPVNIL